MNTYTLYLTDGTIAFVEGTGPLVAIHNAGYREDDFNRVSFFAEGVDNNWEWSPDRKDWVRKRNR